MTGPHEPAVRKPHRVRIDKFCVGVNQIEPTGLEGPYAVVCELGDDLFLARVDRAARSPRSPADLSVHSKADLGFFTHAHDARDPRGEIR